MVARQVGDRSLADDRRHVMLAVRLKRDILEQDDLVVAADLMKYPGEVDRGVFPVTLAIFLPGPADARWHIEQSFAIRVITRPADQRANGVLHVIGNGQLGLWCSSEIAVVIPGHLSLRRFKQIASPVWRKLHERLVPVFL